MARTVGEVAELTSVTIRTLHHYDDIGLVTPSGRSSVGYRLYEDADLERLQQVLIYRELGFPLDDIRRLMSDPSFDRGAALRGQRKLLEAEGERVRAMIAALDVAIAAHEKGLAMNDEELREVFGDFDPRVYEDEVQERWGDTDAYRQSTERASTYTKDDWQRMKDEGDEITRGLADLLAAGTPPADPAAMDLAEAHRRHIGQSFYDCSPEMHRALGEMYVADPRFTATYEAYAPGLAAYVRDAIVANSERRGTGDA